MFFILEAENGSCGYPVWNSSFSHVTINKHSSGKSRRGKEKHEGIFV